MSAHARFNGSMVTVRAGDVVSHPTRGRFLVAVVESASNAPARIWSCDPVPSSFLATECALEESRATSERTMLEHWATIPDGMAHDPRRRIARAIGRAAGWRKLDTSDLTVTPQTLFVNDGDRHVAIVRRVPRGWVWALAPYAPGDDTPFAVDFDAALEAVLAADRRRGAGS